MQPLLNQCDEDPGCSSELRVKGLSFKASKTDLRKFFDGFAVVDMHVCEKGGWRPSAGTAYVKFSDHNEARRAFTRLHFKYCGDRFIELAPAQDGDLERRRMEDMQEGCSLQPSYWVRLVGLPFDASEEDIVSWLGPEVVVKGRYDNIFILHHPHGKPSGHAMVELASAEDQLRAVRKHMSPWASRYIEVFIADVVEVKKARRKYRPRRKAVKCEMGGPGLAQPAFRPGQLQSNQGFGYMHQDAAYQLAKFGSGAGCNLQGQAGLPCANATIGVGSHCFGASAALNPGFDMMASGLHGSGFNGAAMPTHLDALQSYGGHNMMPAGQDYNRALLLQLLDEQQGLGALPAQTMVQQPGLVHQVLGQPAHSSVDVALAHLLSNMHINQQPAHLAHSMHLAHDRPVNAAVPAGKSGLAAGLAFSSQAQNHASLACLTDGLLDLPTHCQGTL